MGSPAEGLLKAISTAVASKLDNLNGDALEMIGLEPPKKSTTLAMAARGVHTWWRVEQRLVRRGSDAWVEGIENE